MLKLKNNATTQLVDFLLDLVNNFKEGSSDFFEYLYSAMEKKKVCPSDKEKWVLNALPHFHAVRQGLIAYKAKEGLAYLNGVLALTAEAVELPADCFNDYALSMRGRTT